MLKHLSIAMAGLLTAASALAAGPVVAPVSPMKWQENKNYFLVEPPQPTASGGKVEVLEGDWNPGRTVILKFASFEAARAFYDTPEYQKAKAAREGAAVMRMVCVEGV